jgi:hypothetical protein
MSDDLVCARCAGPVAEGRCPTCRAARDSLFPGRPMLSPTLLAVVLVMLVIAAVLLSAAGTV